MDNDFGIILIKRKRPLFGVAKKIIEVLGFPNRFCVLYSVDRDKIAITPEKEKHTGHKYVDVEETKDYYWLTGELALYLLKIFPLDKEEVAYFFRGSHIEKEEAVVCDAENKSEVCLDEKNIPNSMRKPIVPLKIAGIIAEMESQYKSHTNDFSTSYNQAIQDKEFGWMMGSTVRYALGREGLSPEKTADYIRKFIEHIDEKSLFVMKRDIDAALRDDDIPCKVIWRTLSDDIGTRLKEIEKTRDEKRQ